MKMIVCYHWCPIMLAKIQVLDHTLPISKAAGKQALTQTMACASAKLLGRTIWQYLSKL